MICAVVGLPFVFRRSDIPPLAPMLTSNWGRHRTAAVGFPQFFAEIRCFLG